MKSFIKIYGPPILKAIKVLERIAVQMPEVCIMDTIISYQIPQYIGRKRSHEPGKTYGDFLIADAPEFAKRYFNSSGIQIQTERCHNILSRSGVSLGEYDFFFEWFEEPNPEKLNELINEIDQALTPLGCLYSITTEKE